MMQYSFNADLRSVLQRLAAESNTNTAAPNRPAHNPVPHPRVLPVRPTAQQPRLEIARVALRPNRWHGAVT